MNNQRFYPVLLAAMPLLIVVFSGRLIQAEPMPNQVLIEAQIWELSSDRNFNWGVIWDYNRKESSSPGDFDIFSADLRLPVFDPLKAASTNKGLFASGDILDLKYGILNLQIQAALQEGKAEVLANPKVVVKDGHLARITTGEKVPLIELTFDPKRQQYFDTVFKDTGVTLSVTPFIHKASPEFVILDVMPTVSEITKFETLKSPDGDFELPQLTTRSVLSKVVVRSGETLIIGGLYQQQFLRNRNKMPFVGNIPLVGDLFQSRVEAAEKRELLIEIRPTILIPGKDSFVPAPFSAASAALQDSSRERDNLLPGDDTRLLGVPIYDSKRRPDKKARFIPQEDAPLPPQKASPAATSSQTNRKSASGGSWY